MIAGVGNPDRRDGRASPPSRATVMRSGAAGFFSARRQGRGSYS